MIATSIVDLDVENRGYAARMAKIFVGNKEAHYLADFNKLTIEESGKHVPQYRAVVGAPTSADFLKHLQGKRGGNIGLLVIPITQAGACQWGKINIDIYDEDRIILAREYAKRIKRLGLPLVVEFSKSGGLHLAHYSKHTQSAADMRGKLSDWAAALRCPTKVEIFPKQDRLVDGDKGSGINLPFFGGDNDDTVNFAVDENGNRMSLERWLTIISSMKPNATSTPGQVDVEGASELMATHWSDGQRDNLNLALGGALIRAGLENNVVQEILDGVSRIAADGASRKTAEQIERDIAAGKRVPGFPKLAELIGAEDVKELMRLVGAEPPPKKLPFDFVPVPRSYRNETPPPLTYTVDPLLPTEVVAMLVAEGGTGKTTFGLRLAVAVAGGREFFGLLTKQGRVVYIGCEEHQRAFRRRIHWITKRERERMMREKCAPETIEEFESSLDQNLIIRSAVGYEIFLIQGAKGGSSQGPIVQELIDDLPRPLELLILDPISRLSNAEENSNQVGTALVNAAERIAREVKCTLLLCHHTGKAAAKDRDTGLYAARGASAFVDAARSSIRLLQADANDVKDFTNVPNAVIAKGDLVQVIHNKSNEGPKANPFWRRRQELDFELFEPVTADGGGAGNRKFLDALYGWWIGASNDRKGFSAKRFEDKDELRAMFAPHAVGKGKAHTVVQDALDNATLIESKVKAHRSPHYLLIFRPDFELEM